MMEKDARIYVAGHRGMVGSAIVRELERQGYTNILTRTHKELDLTRQEAVDRFFAGEKPEYVFLAAAKVGGIAANVSALADFMYENMMLEMNVIHAALRNGCRKLLFLGSSCIYPRMAPQPMKEGCLLTGELEKTNEAYALAKISGLKYCEFLYVDDLADLCVFLMNNYSGNEIVNAGTGKELSIKDLTELVAKAIGYTGEILWDTSKPNGTPRKLLDVSKAAALGWTYRTELEEGIRLAYDDFLNNPVRAER